MMKRLATIAAAGLVAAAAPAFAGFPVSRQMTCPIGGATFDFTTTGSYSTWGSRPDGKPFGSWRFPLEIPECPDNGLIVYKEFEAGEIARLRPLVESAEYQALRRGDTPYYRAAWLMRRLEASPTQPLWLLMQATWEAEPNPALRRRYLEELVAGVAALGEPADLERFALRGRAVNALRELGRFDEAAALIAATLDRFRAAPEGENEEARENRLGWIGFYEQLGRAIARRDASIMPLDLIPVPVAATLCERPDGLEEAQRALCPEILRRAGERRLSD